MTKLYLYLGFGVCIGQVMENHDATKLSNQPRSNVFNYIAWRHPFCQMQLLYKQNQSF